MTPCIGAVVLTINSRCELLPRCLSEKGGLTHTTFALVLNALKESREGLPCISILTWLHLTTQALWKVGVDGMVSCSVSAMSSSFSNPPEGRAPPPRVGGGLA